MFEYRVSRYQKTLSEHTGCKAPKPAELSEVTNPAYENHAVTYRTWPRRQSSSSKRWSTLASADTSTCGSHKRYNTCIKEQESLYGYRRWCYNMCRTLYRLGSRLTRASPKFLSRSHRATALLLVDTVMGDKLAELCIYGGWSERKEHKDTFTGFLRHFLRWLTNLLRMHSQGELSTATPAIFSSLLMGLLLDACSR